MSIKKKIDNELMLWNVEFNMRMERRKLVELQPLMEEYQKELDEEERRFGR